MDSGAGPQRWSRAITRALYGPDGFYLREWPSGHFRTSAQATPWFATALAHLADRVDRALDSPDRFDLVDVGAGDGALLAAIVAELPPRLRRRLRPVAVELRSRPPGLPPAVQWRRNIPAVTGLLLANEWLDNLPVDVVEMTATGPRFLLVDADGTESHGQAPRPEHARWLRRWWPLAEVGGRGEVGLCRDRAWRAAVRRLRRGAAVAMDYDHTLQQRRDGAFRAGSLTGYRDGRQVPPVPDGTCDLTAHVALDACAAAGRGTGTGTGADGGVLLLRQRQALRALGVDGARPPLELARADPAAYLAALTRASTAVELTDPSGLGGFGWLIQAVGIPVARLFPGGPDEPPSVPHRDSGTGMT